MARLRSPAAWLAAGNFLLHLAVLERYGWFRDELYYLACGERLAWGYVDHPPFVALVARLGRTLFGDALWGTRLLPVLAGSLVVYLAGRLARVLGGGGFAEGLAALCVIVAPVYLFLFHILSMNVFDVLFWTLGALVLARILDGGAPHLWLLFGLVVGVGLLTKHSMLFFGLGVFAGLLATAERRRLATPWPWLGGLLAAALFLPHLLWQVRHGWPTLEFIRNAQELKNVALSPPAFLAEQLLLVHPFTLPVWLAGLVWFFTPAGRRFRPLGWVYVVVLAVLLAQAAKPYYLAPVYPILFAGGGVGLEAWARRRRWGWLRLALPAALVAGGAVTAPLTLPLLPVETFRAYARRLGIEPSSGERHAIGALPQHFADMHGWPELAAAVARVHRALPAAERPRCPVFGQNYGEAGAIDLFGPRLGLPPALSGHNSYFLWGPRGATGDCLIVLGDDEPRLRELFGEVRLAGRVDCRYCMPYEDGLTIHVCRRPKRPLGPLWPEVKSYG